MTGEEKYAQLINEFVARKRLSGIGIASGDNRGGNIVINTLLGFEMCIDQIAHVKTDSLTSSQHLGCLLHLRPGGLNDQTNDIDLRHRLFEQRKIIEYLFGHIGLQWC